MQITQESAKNEVLQNEPSKGDYVTVNYEGEFFPGLVIGSDLNGLIVITMTMSGFNWK